MTTNTAQQRAIVIEASFQPVGYTTLSSPHWKELFSTQLSESSEVDKVWTEISEVEKIGPRFFVGFKPRGLLLPLAIEVGMDLEECNEGITESLSLWARLV